MLGRLLGILLAFALATTSLSLLLFAGSAPPSFTATAISLPRIVKIFPLAAAVSCSDAKQQYINGHFCYADKFAIFTNGLGIIRHIVFLDDDFKSKHPEMPVDKKSDSPDEDKSVGDSSSLRPVLSDFFRLHPDFHLSTFLGDSAFDTIETYGFLKNDFHFSKVLIPYNPRNESTLKKAGYNEYGYPTCPNDTSLAMRYCGITKEKGRNYPY